MMQNIQFIQAKNNEISCIFNGIHLHSSYNPTKEAENYVSGLNPDFNPLVIIITEPALSYCLKPLKERFPKAKMGVIRFSNTFNEYNYGWDFVVQINEIQSLITKLGEDLLLSTYFISWQASNKAFPKEYEETWNEIKKVLKTSQDILATRAYFSNRWIKNALRFCVYTKNTYVLKPGNFPIIIAASGPSLKESIPNIKKYRNNFYLIALSSAYEPLINNDIIPDICISTDGGFWAKRHIKKCSIPLVVSAESAITWEKLNSIPIIPIKYGDAPEASLLDICGFKSMIGKRNGTVSGTAVELAFNLTSSEIYACGLDLASCIGFQHIQPNALENDKFISDYRLKNKESRAYPSEFENGSLKIYRDWFSMQKENFSTRFKRLTTKNYIYNNDLGKIKTITWDALDLSTDTSKLTMPKLEENPLPPSTDRIQLIKELFNTIEENCINTEWFSSLLPAEYIAYNKATDKEKALPVLQEKMSEKIGLLMKFLDKLEQSV